MRYLGIDWSRKTSHFDIGDSSGKRLLRGVLDNREESFRKLIKEWKDEEGIFVVIEVGGRVFRWARAMQEEGADVFVLETHQNAMIRESTRKTDKKDSTQLREQGRLGILPPDRVPIPTEAEEDLRLLVQSRSKSVAERTAISNQTTRIADRYDFYMKPGALSALSGWELLLGDSVEWGEVDQLLIKNWYQRYLQIQEQIQTLDDEIERRCRVPELAAKAKLLKTIPGVGPVTTSAILARAGDVTRFKNGRKLVRYAGLAPTQRQSGNSAGTSRLSKSGNSLLRGYLTQAANAVANSKSSESYPLRFWYEQVKKRRGWKKARIALARKILMVAYGILKNNEPFNPGLLVPASRQAG